MFVSLNYDVTSHKTYSVDIQEKTYAGNENQNIHSPLMQKTHTIIHTASIMHPLVKINERHLHKDKMKTGTPPRLGEL